MKQKKIILSILMCCPILLMGNNSVTTVTRVSTAVTLSGNVDYHISSATPFTATGSINLTNVDNAVIILDSLKPTLAKKQLGFISVNGAAAKSGTNCTVKFYRHGSIIMPHGDTYYPLTLYTGENYTGKSSSTFAVGTRLNLDTAYNNKVKSFKLKRGYMLFVSTKAGGYGWNRIFIADKADRVIPILQDELYNKISCIRISKWFDADKRGFSSWSPDYNTPLNTTWCYNWDAGINIWDDREYVTQHHHIGWPDITAVGENGTSPNILTNNEPDNSSQSLATVDQVLASWPEVMAQGKRIGSPAVAGNYTWLKNFIDSIDARGWRCDFLAIHAYWYSDYWMSALNHYSEMCGGRSMWLTEMNYGANWTGWPGDSVTASAANYAIELKHMGPILDKLMAASNVERIAPYNWVQDCRKFVNNATTPISLTPTGEYYSQMDAPLAYDAETEYKVKSPRLYAPSSLKLTYYPSSQAASLSWTEQNCEFTKMMYIERKRNSEDYVVLDSIKTDENTTSFSFRDTTLKESGNYAYRIHSISYNNKDLYSNLAYHIICHTTKYSGDIQYGSIAASTTDDSYLYFAEPYTEMPAVIFGSVTNRNSNLAPVEHVYTSYKLNGNYSYFKFNFFPWTLSWYQTFYQTSDPTETANYLIVKPGNGTIGNLAYEAGFVSTTVGNDTVEMTFKTPFPEGVIPVVFAMPRYTSTIYPYMWRVWDITNKGFKVILQRQAGLTYAGFLKQNVAYFAIEQGKGYDGNGKLFTVGKRDMSFKNKAISYKMEFNDTLKNPIFYTQMQTFNRKCAALLRLRATGPDSVSELIRLQPDSTDTNNNVMTTANPITENIGYVIISDIKGTIVDNINNAEKESNALTILPAIASQDIFISDKSARSAKILSANGTYIKTIMLTEGQATTDVSSLSKGLYLIRTDANHVSRFIKK